jgi:hypothetical protein
MRLFEVKTIKFSQKKDNLQMLVFLYKFDGTVRFVQLPYESHGYAGKKNILHML